MTFSINHKNVSEAGLFRFAFGIYLLCYQAALLTDFGHYFGPESMVNPALLPMRLSLLFFVWNTWVLKALFVSMMMLTVVFMVGRMNKAALAGLFFLQLSFHQANPLIIHEPQQLANLFLLLFFFLPLNDPPNISFGNIVEHKLSNKEIKGVIILMVAYLGVYYFFAGVKKLPDPLWRSGDAFYYLLQWPFTVKENGLTHMLLGYPQVLKFLTYLALIFEIIFIFLVFTPLRPLLIIAGIIIHFGIQLTMNVGSFSMIMLTWYALLLDEPTRKFFIRNKA